MLHNRFDQPVVCMTCCNPPCTADACSTCRVWGDRTCTRRSCNTERAPLHQHWRPKTNKELQQFLCQKCRHPCSLCEERKAQAQFPESMWHHRFAQRTLCLDCCRPRCTSTQCATCTVCRDHTCTKRTRCKDPIRPLHSKKSLTTKEDLATYLCDQCRYITCACGNVMPKATQKRKKSAGTLQKQLYICAGCESRAQWHKDARVRTK